MNDEQFDELYQRARRVFHGAWPGLTNTISLIHEHRNEMTAEQFHELVGAAVDWSVNNVVAISQGPCS